METVIIAIIIGVSVGYLGLNFWRSVKKSAGKKGCSSGCGCGKN